VDMKKIVIGKASCALNCEKRGTKEATARIELLKSSGAELGSHHEASHLGVDVHSPHLPRLYPPDAPISLPGCV